MKLTKDGVQYVVVLNYIKGYGLINNNDIIGLTKKQRQMPVIFVDTDHFKFYIPAN